MNASVHSTASHSGRMFVAWAPLPIGMPGSGVECRPPWLMPMPLMLPIRCANVPQGYRGRERSRRSQTRCDPWGYYGLCDEQPWLPEVPATADRDRALHPDHVGPDLAARRPAAVSELHVHARHRHRGL